MLCCDDCEGWLAQHSEAAALRCHAVEILPHFCGADPNASPGMLQLDIEANRTGRIRPPPSRSCRPMTETGSMRPLALRYGALTELSPEPFVAAVISAHAVDEPAHGLSVRAASYC